MATLRANNVGDISGTVNPMTLSSTSTTTATWPSAPSNMPAVNSPDILKITLEPNTTNEEIVYVTAYTSGATSATVTRNQEGLNPGIAHNGVAWAHGPTALDFPGPQGAQGAAGTQGAQGVAGAQGPQGAGANVNPLIGTPASQVVLSTQVTGDANNRLQLTAGGTFNSGDGTNPLFPSLSLGTTTSGNVFIGPQAGYTVTTGVHNTLIGLNAGYGILATGNNSVNIGMNSGPTTDVAGGTSIGQNANYSGTNATAIGRASKANANYTTAIGASTIASALGSMAIGTDSTGAAANSTVQDTAVFGTALTQLRAAGFATAFATKTANYAMARTDNTILCNASSVINVTMPNPATAGAGAEYQIINYSGSYSVNVMPFGSEYIGGFAGGYTLYTQQTIQLTTDGTNWYTLPGPAGSQAGPQGAQGAQGSAGAQGAQGAQGNPASVNPLIGGATSTVVLSTQVAGDTNDRYEITAGGTINVGTGAAATIPALNLAKPNTLVGAQYNSGGGSNLTLIGVQAASGIGASNATAVGVQAGAGGTAVAIGFLSSANGSNSTVVGAQANTGSANSVVVGFGAQSTGTYGIAIGSQTTMSANAAIAIGYQATSTGTQGVAMGQGAQAGQYGVALGYRAIGPANNVAIGYGAQAAANTYSVALGTNAVVGTGGSYGMALGYGSQATNFYDTTMGYNSVASGGPSLALGAFIQATAPGAIAIGLDSTNASVAPVQDQACIGTTKTQLKTGSFATGISVKTTSYNMVRADSTILANGAITVAMPNPTSAGVGAMYRIINITSASTVTVHPYSGETIEGASGLLLGPNLGIELVTDGTNWFTHSSPQVFTGSTAPSPVAPYSIWLDTSTTVNTITPGMVLNRVQYGPASLQNYPLVSATLTALDTTNLTIPFTVPPSGAVTLEADIFTFGGIATANYVATMLGFLNHSGGALIGAVGYGMYYTNPAAASGGMGVRAVFRTLVTGLTAAANMQVDLAGYYVSSGTPSTVNCQCDNGPTGGALHPGPALLTVFAA